MPDSTERRFVAVDLETSGFDAATDDVIEVGLVAFTRESGVTERWESLVRPEREVPFAALKVTGIEPGELEVAPRLSELTDGIRTFIGESVVVGQSIDFDIAFLKMAGVDEPALTLDTWHLASIFLPGLENYRLETIARSLGIQLEEAHRAPADAEATAEVVLKLLDRIEAELSPELAAELGVLLEKSSYGLRKIWPLLRPSGTESIRSAQKEPEVFDGFDSQIRGFVDDLRVSSKQHLLGVIPPSGELTPALAESLRGLQPEQPVLLSAPSLQLARRLVGSIPGAAVRLPPEHYLSLGRAESYLDRESFDEGEIVFALRLRLFLEWASEGTRDELPLFDRDYRLWELVSCRGLGPDDLALEKYWTAAGNRLSGAKVLVTNHRSLAEIEIPVEVVVGEADILDELLTTSLSVRLDQRDGEGLSDRAGSEFDLMMGLLGIVVESQGAGEDATVRLKQAAFSGKQWRQFEAAAQNFVDRQGAEGEDWLGRAVLQRIQERLRRLLEMAPTEIVWVRSWRGNLSLHVAPQSTAPWLERLGDGRRVRLLGRTAEIAPAGYEVMILEGEAERRPRVGLVRPAGATPRDASELAEIIAGLIPPEGRVAVFCASNSAIRELTPALESRTEREIVAPAVTGGVNQIEEKLTDAPTAVLIVGPRQWGDQRLPSWFDTIIVPKVSFDIPTDPLHEARAERAGGFMGYSLPRARARLRSILPKLKPGGRLILLDPRLTSQRYGAELLKIGVPVEEVDRPSPS